MKVMEHWNCLFCTAVVEVAVPGPDDSDKAPDGWRILRAFAEDPRFDEEPPGRDALYVCPAHVSVLRDRLEYDRTAEVRLHNGDVLARRARRFSEGA